MSPPSSQFGPIDSSLRNELIKKSSLAGVYDETIDRESAHEVLLQRGAEKIAQRESLSEREDSARKPRKSNRQSVGESFAKSIARALGSSLGRQIIRGILGSITGRG